MIQYAIYFYNHCKSLAINSSAWFCREFESVRGRWVAGHLHSSTCPNSASRSRGPSVNACKCVMICATTWTLDLCCNLGHFMMFHDVSFCMESAEVSSVVEKNDTSSVEPLLIQVMGEFDGPEFSRMNARRVAIWQTSTLDWNGIKQAIFLLIMFPNIFVP